MIIDKMIKKSQSSIEFIILVGFVLLFFIIFFLVIQINIGDKIKERKNLAVKEIAFAIQDEINLASKSTDGYQRRFKIANKIGEEDYYAKIIDGIIYVKTSDGKNAIALPVSNVTGDILKGDNLIRKENGGIYLNQ